MDEPKKILIVEDDEDCRVILVCRLRKLGRFDIREAANGQQAIDAVRADPPDLIFMDDRMPVMDGWEATERIRQMDGGGDVRVIALAGGRRPVRSRRRSPAAATTTSPSRSWTPTLCARRSNAGSVEHTHPRASTLDLQRLP